MAYHGMAIIIAIIPLFVSLLLGFLHYGTRIRFHVPLLTDECVYWSRLDAMVHYGNPLGYFGYVGSKGDIWCNCLRVLS